MPIISIYLDRFIYPFNGYGYYDINHLRASKIRFRKFFCVYHSKWVSKFRLITVCGSLLLYKISIPSGTLLKARTKMVKTCRWLEGMTKSINPIKTGLKMVIRYITRKPSQSQVKNFNTTVLKTVLSGFEHKSGLATFSRDVVDGKVCMCCTNHPNFYEVYSSCKGY